MIQGLNDFRQHGQMQLSMRIALQDDFLMVVEMRVVVMRASLRWHAADLPASVSPL